MDKLYIFVEGPDDERFINSILKGWNIKPVLYAREKKQKINSFIQSINSMPGSDYVVLCDIDRKTVEDKKNEIASNFPNCDLNKIMVSIAEIESWYLAGLDEDRSKKLHIKFYKNTDSITKEKFDTLIPNRFTRVNFMIEILNDYNVSEARTRNRSFDYFINYVLQWDDTAVFNCNR